MYCIHHCMGIHHGPAQPSIRVSETNLHWMRQMCELGLPDEAREKWLQANEASTGYSSNGYKRPERRIINKIQQE